MKVPRVLLEQITPLHKHILEQTTKILDGNVSFGSTTDNLGLDRNIETFYASGTTPAVANTEFIVAHTLKRPPVGFVVIRLDQAAIIYADATDLAAWSSTNFAAKCSVASVNYRIYLL